MCSCDGFYSAIDFGYYILSNPPIQFPTLAGIMTSELSSQACCLGPLYEGRGPAAWGAVLENGYSVTGTLVFGTIVLWVQQPGVWF
jgi:hypothetical protein